MISGKTKVVVHLAHPADHLRTPAFFNARCAELGHDMVLVPWDVRPEDLAATFAALRKIRNLAGVVVTIPHKESIARLCDELAPEASAIGVCNVARRDNDGKFIGEIFDGVGFVTGLKTQGHEIENQHAYLIGAGGAGTAIAHALAGSGVASLSISNRTISKAEQLARSINERFPHLDVSASTDIPPNATLLVNSTSVGMHDGDDLPFDIEGIRANSIVAEVIMEPDETELLKAAKDRGAIPHRGVHMIEAQIDLLIEHLLGK